MPGEITTSRGGRDDVGLGVLREVQTIPEADEPVTTLENQIQAYAQQIQDDPENLGLLLHHAEANLMGGRSLEALRAFQSIRDSHPQTVEACLAIARIYMVQRRFEESYAEVSRMLTAWPSNAGAHLLLKLLTRQADVPPEYIETIRQVNGYLPPPDDIQGLRDKFATERQRIGQDIEEFESLQAQIDNQDPVVEYHVVCARLRQGFVDSAVAVLDVWERTRLEQEQEQERLRLQQEEYEREQQRLEEERLRLAEQERLRAEEEERERERVRQEEEAQREQQRAEEQERLRLEEETRHQAEAEALRRPEPSSARKGFYEQHKSALAEIVSMLGKTRNVSAVMIVSRDGFVVHQDIKELVPEAELAQFVQDGLTYLEEQHAGKFSLWVLEFDKGILVVQSIHAQHILLLLGGLGANFGSLKFVMDKARPQLTALLQNVPVG